MGVQNVPQYPLFAPADKRNLGFHRLGIGSGGVIATQYGIPGLVVSDFSSGVATACFPAARGGNFAGSVEESTTVYGVQGLLRANAPSGSATGCWSFRTFGPTGAALTPAEGDEIEVVAYLTYSAAGNGIDNGQGP